MNKRKSVTHRIIEYFYLQIPGNLAHYDQTFHVHNRNYFSGVIRKKYHKASCKVIFVDIDNLKIINDTKGHNYGNALIKVIIDSLKSLPDVLEVVRYGGDEIIVIADTDFNDDLLSMIHNISYGVYHKNATESIDSAIMHADRLMYQMKSTHKG